MNGITSPSLFCIFRLFGISGNLNSCYFYNMSNWEEVFNFMRAGLRDLDLNAVFFGGGSLSQFGWPIYESKTSLVDMSCPCNISLKLNHLISRRG